MSILDTAAQNASLDNDYGATAGSNAPSAHQLALFNGDPLLGGTELTSTGGYARVTVTNNGTNWPGASAGATVSAPIAMPTSTGAWSDTATHWALIDDGDGTTRWDSGPLTDEVSVDAAGVDVSVICTVYYGGL